nr:MAG TPA: hypothetical protein [Caudoviricetes sp.]
MKLLFENIILPRGPDPLFRVKIYADLYGDI